MIENLFIFLNQLISKTGYLGIFFLMTLESMIFPIPSEAVMPFAGYLVYTQFSWLGVLLSSTAGSLFGSYLSYLMGAYGILPILYRYGHYLLITHEKLDKTHEFSDKYGTYTILFARLVPVVRHFISIYAGINKMSLGLFFIFTALGASFWNMFLAYIGYIARDNMHIISKYKHIADLAGILIVLVFIGISVYSWWQKQKTTDK